MAEPSDESATDEATDSDDDDTVSHDSAVEYDSDDGGDMFVHDLDAAEDQAIMRRED